MNEQKGFVMRVSKVLAAFVLLTLTASPLTLSAQAQTGKQGQTAVEPQQLDELTQVRQEIEQVGKKLEAIERSAVQANPQLKERQQRFRDILVQTMRESGYEPQQNIERLQELEQQLGQQDLQSEERVQLMQEFQQRVVALQQAEQDALQKANVQQARQDLAAAMLTAMQEQDPSTDELIERMQRAHERLQELLPVTPDPSGEGAAPSPR